ncbi:MAG: 6-carboxytetrahydropterin synthase, partial [Pseudomonadota bacterium]
MTQGIGDEQLFYTAAARFEAARQLSSSPAGHPSRSLHGHSFLATMRVADSAGWAAFAGDEVAELRRRLTRTTAPLDYQHLNTTLDQPTDENLARWIRTHLDLNGACSVGIQSTR